MPSLVFHYRSRGWRWPVQAGDRVEWFDDAHFRVAEFDGALMVEIVAHYLEGARLAGALLATVEPVPRVRVKRHPAPTADGGMKWDDASQVVVGGPN